MLTFPPPARRNLRRSCSQAPPWSGGNSKGGEAPPSQNRERKAQALGREDCEQNSADEKDGPALSENYERQEGGRRDHGPGSCRRQGDVGGHAWSRLAPQWKRPQRAGRLQSSKKHFNYDQEGEREASEPVHEDIRRGGREGGEGERSRDEK